MTAPELDRVTNEYRSWASHWSRPEVYRQDLAIPPMVPLTPELSALLDKVAAADDAYIEALDAPEDIIADARVAHAAYLAAVRTAGVAVADGKPVPKTLPKPVNTADVETRVRIAMTAADATAHRLRTAQKAAETAIEADQARWREPILAWLAETAEEREKARRRALELEALEALANDGLKLANKALGLDQPKAGGNRFVTPHMIHGDSH